MFHSYSIHSFKTLDGLAKYIYGLIKDTDFDEFTANEEPDINAIADWFTNNLSFDEEVGKYIAYIDCFTDGDLKVADKFYNAINKVADDNSDINTSKIADAYNEVNASLTEKEQNTWQINGFLENLDTNLAKLDDKSFITIAYIHTTNDSAGMMTAGGYMNFKSLEDAAEYINKLYEDDGFGDDINNWFDNNITADADEPGMYAVYIRSFED